MSGVEGTDPRGAKLFEYPRTKERDKFNPYLVPLFYGPLVILLYIYWPLSEGCLILEVIAFVFATLIIGPFLPSDGPVIEVYQHSMRVGSEEFHPDQLDSIETYYDQGHFGGKVENSPHSVFIFRWVSEDGYPQTLELPLRMRRETHVLVTAGLKRAIPGIRLMELPEKGIRLRK